MTYHSGVFYICWNKEKWQSRSICLIVKSKDYSINNLNFNNQVIIKYKNTYNKHNGISFERVEEISWWVQRREGGPHQGASGCQSQPTIQPAQAINRIGGSATSEARRTSSRYRFRRWEWMFRNRFPQFRRQTCRRWGGCVHRCTRLEWLHTQWDANWPIPQFRRVFQPKHAAASNLRVISIQVAYYITCIERSSHFKSHILS